MDWPWSSGSQGVLLIEVQFRWDPEGADASPCFPEAAFFLNTRPGGPLSGGPRVTYLVCQCLFYHRNGFFIREETRGRACFFLEVHILIFIKMSLMWLMPSNYEDSHSFEYCCMKSTKLKRQVLGVKALVYLPHLFVGVFFFFCSLSLSFLLYDSWKCP